MLIYYKNLCPNCGKNISSIRLNKGIFCSFCMNEGEQKCEIKKLNQYRFVCETEKELEQFKRHFEKTTGKLLNIQKNWAKKFFLGTSFSILAPTGTGKTTFGINLASFLSKKGGKSYLIFPTYALVDQAYERLREIEERVVAYHSKLKGKEKSEVRERIRKGEFDILITTNMFLYKNIEEIPKKAYRLVFVDDVDSVLKSGKRIDTIFRILGFDKQDLDRILKTIKSFKNKTPEEIEKLRRYIKKIAKNKKGQLIVSSATSNPKSSRIKLFRELLGFEVGKPHIAVRNVVDVCERVEKDLWGRASELIKKFGKGGLVFLPGSEGKEGLHEFLTWLKKEGIRAESYETWEKAKEDFKQGNVEVLVGFSSYKNPLARGIDMPETVRYALFVGVPKMLFNIKSLDNPRTLLILLSSLVPFLARKKLVGEETIERLYRYMDFLKKNLPKENLKETQTIKEEITNLIENKRIKKELLRGEEISLRIKENNIEFVIGDVTGYVQASGRTSRLYFNGLTTGLSYLLIDDEKAFNSLMRRFRYIGEEIKFLNAEDVDFKGLFRKIDKERKELRKDRRTIKDIFSTALVLVESPNKARTIASFFGKPVRRILGNMNVYETFTNNLFLVITATGGHVVDLTKTNEGIYGVLKEENFIPIYEPLEGKDEIILGIRRLSLEVDEILIATDPDREGEKIAFDISSLVKPFNNDVSRIEFHEVTKKAFLDAVLNKRDLDKKLVEAQLLRRIADRWVGFKISEYLRKKLKKPWLSAGRVQTPVLEWIVEREKESKKKHYVLEILLENGLSLEFLSEKKVSVERDEVEIETVKKEKKKMFEEPFNTPHLLKESGAVFGFSPQYTMELAQTLFEMGFISYHRTDSRRVSSEGIKIAREIITENFGEEYFQPRSFSSEGGAHECIRITKPLTPEELRMVLEQRGEKYDKNLVKLYGLIFKQFIASQMKEMVVEKTKIRARIDGLTTEKEVITKILEDGFNLIKPVKTYELRSVERIKEKKEGWKARVPPYSFSSIVEEMETKGIGRPSTYAVTIEKLLKRKYIIAKKSLLFPTSIGKMLIEQIRKTYYYQFVKEDYTRELEEKMDRVERGEMEYQKELWQLYAQLFKH